MNLVLDVVEILNLRHSDVVLQDALEDLLLLFRDCVRVLIFDGFFQVTAQVLLKLCLFVAERGVPVVLDRVVAAA